MVKSKSRKGSNQNLIKWTNQNLKTRVKSKSRKVKNVNFFFLEIKESNENLMENLYFARFVEIDAESLVPGLLAARLPVGLRHRHVVQFDDGHYLVARLVLDAVRLGRAPTCHTFSISI